MQLMVVTHQKTLRRLCSLTASHSLIQRNLKVIENNVTSIYLSSYLLLIAGVFALPLTSKYKFYGVFGYSLIPACDFANTESLFTLYNWILSDSISQHLLLIMSRHYLLEPRVTFDKISPPQTAGLMEEFSLRL